MMRGMIWALAMLALSAAFADELTLDQALALALKNNRLVANAKLEVEKSGIQIEIAHTYKLPAFQLKVFEGQFLAPFKFEFPAGTWGVYPATGPIPATQADINSPRTPYTLVNGSVTQPISRLPRLRAGIRLREIERDAARTRLDAVEQAVASDVRKLYYSILRTASAITANESAIGSLRELDRVTGEAVARQVALRSEALEVKARLARLEYESAELLHSVVSQKEQLNDLLGRDARTEFTVASLPEPSMAASDLAEARSHALAGRPEIAEAKLKIRGAEEDRAIKRTERYPDVDITAQYLSPFRIALLPKNITTAGVQVSWDVFDWGRRNKELAVKDLAIQQAKNSLLTVQSQVLIEVENLYRKLEESRRLLQVVRMAQDAARERVRIARDRQGLEAALLKDVLEAQTSLAETDYQYQQALASYWSAQADFDHATGRK